MPWMTDAGAANVLGAYRFHYEAKKRQYTEQELMVRNP